jgi:ABC-type multidrug transport system ATPase subunit
MVLSLGYLSQEPRYYRWMTGVELLEMVAGLFGIPTGESKNRIRELLDLISRLRERTTIFMSTHILAAVERVCDRVGILKNGRLIALETIMGIQEKFSPSPHLRESVLRSLDFDEFRRFCGSKSELSLQPGCVEE